jgi:acylphosphatase
MKKRAHITVTGRVQGVSFRYYTQRTASALGLHGYVRNLPNSDVEIVAEGEEDSLRKLVEWAHMGPPYAEVAGVSVEWSDGTNGFGEFTVRY